jgi:Tfp pilus assembly protein PilN
VKAVNLIPADARKRGGGVSSSSQLATYGLFGVLAVVLGLVIYYVTTSNAVSSRQAQLTTLRAEVAQAQARVSSLGNYTRFHQLAQTRAQTVEGIAATRFDWHSAMSDLTRVVPANTSLQSLTATVAPGATAGGSGGSGSAGSLRSNISAPAFELVGCTANQDDVAKLMSRLRLIDGVTRVTLGSSQKTSSAQGGASVSGGGAQGCGPNKPNFDVVVFFQPVQGAGPSGATSVGTVMTSGGTK